LRRNDAEPAVPEWCPAMKANMGPVTCRAIRGDGQPCRSRSSLSADGLCGMHDPARAPAWAEARSRAGKASIRRRFFRPPQLPTTLEEAAGFAAWAAWAVASGKLSPQAGKTIESLLSEFREARGAIDMSERIHELERQLKALKQQRRTS